MKGLPLCHNVFAVRSFIILSSRKTFHNESVCFTGNFKNIVSIFMYYKQSHDYIRLQRM